MNRAGTRAWQGTYPRLGYSWLGSVLGPVERPKRKRLMWAHALICPPLHPRPCPGNARREQNRLCPSSLSLAGLQGLHKPDQTVSSTSNCLSLLFLGGCSGFILLEYWSFFLRSIRSKGQHPRFRPKC